MAINILGMGPGHRDYVTPKALRIIEKSDVLIGGKRLLSDYSTPDKETLSIGNNLKEVMAYINKHSSDKVISVLLSGDTGFYSMLTYIKKNIDDMDAINVEPGISSFQYLFAKLNKTWQNCYLSSVHGRQQDYIKRLNENDMVVLLTDTRENTPRRIAIKLIESGNDECIMHVGQELSYPNERIVSESPLEIKGMEFGMSVVVIEK